jgi:hypothetical protein
MKFKWYSNWLAVIGWLAVGWVQAEEAPPGVASPIDFERDIRPMLLQHCGACHSEAKQESGLRLDHREEALLGGDSGKAILPGDGHNSRLIVYVSGREPEHLMPPDGPPLSPAQVRLLEQWIDEGANWPAETKSTRSSNSHWAYQPILKIQPPATAELSASGLSAARSQSTVRNEIDQFIVSKLHAMGLTPAPEADRTTLIRRLSLDLRGLLPSLEEVDTFVGDGSPTAYEDLVDRLLNSPHFGERWGRHWLDMARYADSDGYEKDNPRPDAYRYRDWVIDAINADMPFDQFTVEQLAGDLLPNASDMQRLATAFHRQTLTNTEGGTDQEQFRVEACFDRTETTGAIWLGLTVGCARCHSHKYEAISQREYYQLFSFFNNADEQTHVVPKSLSEIRSYESAQAEHTAKLAPLRAALVAARADLKPDLKIWEATMQARLKELAEHPVKPYVFMPSQTISDGNVTFTRQKDDSWLVSGDNPETVTYTLVGKAPGAFDTLRLQVLADKSLPATGPGRVAHGNFVLSEISLESSATEDFAAPVGLEFVSGSSDHEQVGWPVSQAIDGDEATGWAVAPQLGTDHWAEFRLKSPQPASAEHWVRVRLVHKYGQQHSLGRFKVTFQTGSDADLELPQQITEVLALPSEQRRPEHDEQVLAYYSRIAPNTKSLVTQLEEMQQQAPAKPEMTVRVLAQRTKEQRETYVLRRGEFLEPLQDALVEPAGLATLPDLVSRAADQPADRLDLARWLVSPKNPLTPRVTVNHIWRQLFGNGIVRTASDFGVRGDLPTHPELLDWLAAEFIGIDPAEEHPGPSSVSNRAWSRKSLIKLIVMSATYRQSSRQTPELAQLDPQNQWLARQNRLRVEGEIVRDISLAVAGLLSPHIGGPSVFPSLPPGVAELSYAGNFKWTVSPGAAQYRRGMYTFFKRTAPHPNLITFDCPDANLTCIQRNTSNTPLQALVSLNNDSFTEAARAFAWRIVSFEDTTDVGRVENAFRMCLARYPSEFESAQLLSLFASAHTWYAQREEDAKNLIGASAPAVTSAPKGASLAELAAWTTTARILLNLDEFITRE